MARYPERAYTNRYGRLVISVKYKDGAYWAAVRRPSDGYEMTIETLEKTPSGAAMYALIHLATDGSPDDLSVSSDAQDALDEAEEAFVNRDSQGFSI